MWVSIALAIQQEETPVRNERGTVIVWITLMIVLLLGMVGMGLNTGQIVYSRSTSQAAVDAAALSAVSALPTKDPALVEARAVAFLSKNDYTGSSKNPIGAANVSYVQYDFAANKVTSYGVPIAAANGVRVALEGGSAVKSPSFLTPIMNLFGASVSATNNVQVSAVSVISARPSIPIALWQSVCNGTNTVKDVEIAQQNPNNGENSCWTTYLDKSSGASDIKALFTAGETCSGLPEGNIDIGTPIYENKGQVASVYGVADDFFLKNTTTKGRYWLIPVIAGTGNCNAKDPSPIVDWAKIKVSEVSKHGSDSYIKADITCKQGFQANENSLCYSHRLVREPAKGM